MNDQLKYNKLGMCLTPPGYNELGMCLTPIHNPKEMAMPPHTTKSLMTRNTGTQFFLDDEDFHICKHVQWYEWKEEVVTRDRVRLVDYIKILGQRKKDTYMFDYRRINYG